MFFIPHADPVLETKLSSPVVFSCLIYIFVCLAVSFKAQKDVVAHSLENDWDVQASGSTVTWRRAAGELLRGFERTDRMFGFCTTWK